MSNDEKLVRTGVRNRGGSAREQDHENLRKLSEELERALDEGAKRLRPPSTRPPEASFIDLVSPQFGAPALIVGELCALATRMP